MNKARARGRIGAQAERLADALNRPGAEGRPDPTVPGRIAVRLVGGVSLGAGSHPLAAAQALVGEGLAAWHDGPSGRRLDLTAAGRANRRRASAGADQAFLAQHADLRAETVVDGAGDRTRVTVNAAESPLDWLRRRRDRDGSPLIDAAQHEAGERLRRDLTLAALLPGVTMNWTSFGSGSSGGGARGPAAASDTVIAARQRVRAALEAIGGDLADVLIDLCGFLKGLETLERERRWPARAGKIVVRLALARLADHYGLAAEAQGPARSSGVRLWRALLDGEAA